MQERFSRIVLGVPLALSSSFLFKYIFVIVVVKTLIFDAGSIVLVLLLALSSPRVHFFCSSIHSTLHYETIIKTTIYIDTFVSPVGLPDSIHCTVAVLVAF